MIFLNVFEQSSFGALRQAKNGDWIMEGLTWGTKAPDFSKNNSDSCCFTEKFTMQATGDATLYVISASRTVKTVLTV